MATPLALSSMDLLVDVFGVDTEGEFNTGFFCIEFPGERQGECGVISRIPKTRAIGFCERGDLRVRDIEECNACPQSADVFYREWRTRDSCSGYRQARIFVCLRNWFFRVGLSRLGSSRYWLHHWRVRQTHHRDCLPVHRDRFSETGHSRRADIGCGMTGNTPQCQKQK